MDGVALLRPKPSFLPQSLLMKKDIYLSIIIPAYNEEKRISKTLAAIASYVQQKNYRYEIIVVSSKSTDNTVQVVEAMKKDIPNLEVIDAPVNRGKGDSVRVGMRAASGKIRLFMDADNATDISHFEKMRPLFDEGYEVVICSREARDAVGATQAVSQPFHKRLLGDMGNLFIQLVAVRGIWDTQCGFKAFRNFAAERIFSEMKITGFGFDIEVLALSRLFGYTIGIVPAHWVNDPHTKVNLFSYIKVLWETIIVGWNLRRGKYIHTNEHHESEIS
ncbi:MAG: glycosyltransferase family 2 protein [bacterium]|nr:glycosyltransferase family 2 protein [bacterium]